MSDDVTEVHPLASAAAAVDDDPDQEWTPEAIRAEHKAALASFTPVQARALARINRAFRESHLRDRSAKELLHYVYEEEARERNAERSRRAGGAPNPSPSVEPPQADSPEDQRGGAKLRMPDAGGAAPVTPRPAGAPPLTPRPTEDEPDAQQGFSDTESVTSDRSSSSRG